MKKIFASLFLAVTLVISSVALVGCNDVNNKSYTFSEDYSITLVKTVDENGNVTETETHTAREYAIMGLGLTENTTFTAEEEEAIADFIHDNNYCIGVTLNFKNKNGGNYTMATEPSGTSKEFDVEEMEFICEKLEKDRYLISSNYAYGSFYRISSVAVLDFSGDKATAQLCIGESTHYSVGDLVYATYTLERV